MNYYRYNENFEYIGVTETEPQDNLWTNIPYVDAFYKPMFINDIWVESANSEELEIYRKSLIPQYNTPMQFKLALLQVTGITPNDVATFINAIPEPNRTMAGISWNSATVFDRWYESLNNLAEAMGITQEQLDEIFILGITIK